MYLIFDTETTGLPKNYNAPHTDLDNWPRLVQIAWQVHDKNGKLLSAQNFIIKPEGFSIPFNSVKIHGITTERALEEGHDLNEALKVFDADIQKAQVLIGHNIEFDLNIMGAEFVRATVETQMWNTSHYCTKDETTDFVQIPGGRGGKFKWPTLTELHTKLFGKAFDDAHDAAYDVDATSRCFFGLIDAKWYQPLDGVPSEEITYEAPDLADANFAHKEDDNNAEVKKVDVSTIDAPFSHLHVHSQFSILQATCEVRALVSKAKEYKMPAIAMTDLGNMMGVFHFVREAIKNDIIPIVGSEFFVAEDRKRHQFKKDDPDKRFAQVLLAKNRNGYNNLIKLSSLGYMEGLYGLYPRIDKDLLKEYSKDVIALTGGLSGEIPNLILNVGEEVAEKALLWYKEIYGDDYYIELIRHGLDEENHLNQVLLGFAKKYDIKVIAANDVFYVDKENANAHDILLCVKDGEKQATPIGRGRGFRYGFPNQEYYLKSQEEMKTLFADIPEAITNIQGIVDKIEPFELEREVLLPAFDIPEEFVDPSDAEGDGQGKKGENNYLKHLTYVGAKKRYGEITPEIKERLDFELATIENTGYPGYFLIVQDFTTQAREMGVSVGPGRGSAAGSAVAYCVGITNVDPIKYDLLFERFLNPDRVSLPDIDIDFDDEGRGKIIEWVVNKYGRSQVAQIITYGTMAAKSSIRDTARVLDLPLPESMALTKLVPDTSLAKVFSLDNEALKEKLKNNPEQIANAEKLKDLNLQSTLEGKIVQQARVLEGSVRNTGIHACGVIITPDDITNYVPVSYTKDATLINTQFDNSVVEDAGLLKMDFLGLKTLSIIKTAIKNVKKRHNVEIDPDEIPLDDQLTYELYQKGLTNGTFQFESPGMQKHLKALKPDKFEDLIAMNALYRPGPIEYIPNFIARKHGDEEIVYDLAAMEEYLGETYGITVYQEQVMLLSQSLADFTKGEADVLRKAMGKKNLALLEKLKPKFIEGAVANGHDAKILEKVWKDWEAFAAYAFNKSHATCYSVVAFQTAYLKAHYPAEYMAAVLSHNQSNIEKVTFFMEECKNLDIPVLGPDVNESGIDFQVNAKGQIRFGLAAIKGAGEAAGESLIQEREENGMFKDVFDFGERVNLRMVNKKYFEVLAMSGGFDCFTEHHRRQYLDAPEGEKTLSELVVKYAAKKAAESESAQASLFGGGDAGDEVKPRAPRIEPFGELEKLNIEKEVVGLYITGHPLDEFKLEIENFCTCQGNEIENYKGRDVSMAGIVSRASERMTKTGKPFGLFAVDDYTGNVDMAMFGEEYLKVKHFLVPGTFVFLKGKVEERYNQPGLWEFRPTNIELLSEVRQKLCKGLALDIDMEFLDNHLVETISEVISLNPGDLTLRINILDKEENLKVDMLSRRFKVGATNELMEELKNINGIQVKILSKA